MAFMLDTNIVIYILDGHPPVLRGRLELVRAGELAMSAITYAETARKLQAGHERRLDALIAKIPIVPFDTAAALAYQRVPFRRGGFDRLIAAHALSTGATLVTNDLSGFTNVPGLRLENWTLA